jgi:hypothetical protein
MGKAEMMGGKAAEREYLRSKFERNMKAMVELQSLIRGVICRARWRRKALENALSRQTKRARQ